MLIEKSGVPFGEDPLSSSTYYTSGSNTDTSSHSFVTSSSNSFVSSTSSSSTNSQKNRASPLLGLLHWFGFGGTEVRRQDKETIDEILKCFRNNDVVGMDKFLNVPMIVKPSEDVNELWWDNGFEAENEEKREIFEEPKKNLPKPTPHVKKIISQLPPKVRKAVRFELDNTPEEKPDRPFTPLFTSTPKQAEDGECSSDDDDLPPLRDVDSNTVINPANCQNNPHNNTSSILLANYSVMESWHKSRQQTDNALRLVDSQRSNNHYRICYDDTDEEEVEDVGETPRKTFVISTSTEHSSDLSVENLKSTTIHEQSFDMDTSTDSSVVLGLDRIEDYIRSLEDEIIAAKRFAREKDVVRARAAVRHALVLQERFAQMNEAIREMCENLQLESEEDVIAEGDQKNMSAVFEDSCWAARLDLERGSFDGNQL